MNVDLLYEFPGGNQVDGLPPVTIQVEGRKASRYASAYFSADLAKVIRPQYFDDNFCSSVKTRVYHTLTLRLHYVLCLAMRYGPR